MIEPHRFAATNSTSAPDRITPAPDGLPGARAHEHLRNYPPVSDWDNHIEYDAKAHPRKVARSYSLVPTTCFNCESACGLLAYVDNDDLTVKKVEGNPAHPGSRGRNCAKGPATINQMNDPERILYPCVTAAAHRPRSLVTGVVSSSRARPARRCSARFRSISSCVRLATPACQSCLRHRGPPRREN
jgi:anaerobic selenocysteine-containing dehydrogenase